jgi:hypothetical protein
MHTFHLEQAIFASSDRGSIKGYQLVARSAGVDRGTAQSLCRWSPTQMPCESEQSWTINYFPVDEHTVAISRTVLGGPEYSSRGGVHVVTLILLMNNDHFHAYSCHPILVAKTALAIGFLRLPLNLDHEQLPPVTLPSQPLVLSPCPKVAEVDSRGQHRSSEPEEAILDELADLIRQTQRVALIGLRDPIATMDRLIPKLPLDVRREFSFTTGLAPTVRRPFQAHCLPRIDVARQRALEAQSIQRFDASRAS